MASCTLLVTRIQPAAGVRDPHQQPPALQRVPQHHLLFPSFNQKSPTAETGPQANQTWVCVPNASRPGWGLLSSTAATSERPAVPDASFTLAQISLLS